jgi:aryl-alcohol dehydrogenase-like predicted oxidoreductase
VVLAWLLARSEAILPIPGSGSAKHVASNVEAAGIRLDPEEVAALTSR